MPAAAGRPWGPLLAAPASPSSTHPSQDGHRHAWPASCAGQPAGVGGDAGLAAEAATAATRASRNGRADAAGRTRWRSACRKEPRPAASLCCSSVKSAEGSPPLVLASQWLRTELELVPATPAMPGVRPTGRWPLRTRPGPMRPGAASNAARRRRSPDSRPRVTACAACPRAAACFIPAAPDRASRACRPFAPGIAPPCILRGYCHGPAPSCPFVLSRTLLTSAVLAP